jgi:hypothetical protein
MVGCPRSARIRIQSWQYNSMRERFTKINMHNYTLSFMRILLVYVYQKRTSTRLRKHVKG